MSRLAMPWWSPFSPQCTLVSSRWHCSRLEVVQRLRDSSSCRKSALTALSWSSVKAAHWDTKKNTEDSNVTPGNICSARKQTSASLTIGYITGNRDLMPIWLLVVAARVRGFPLQKSDSADYINSVKLI